MRPIKPPKPTNRNGTWYLYRRVPKEYADVDKRTFVKISTGIVVAHDPRGFRAQPVVNSLNQSLEEYWQMRAYGRSDDAKVRFAAAQERAKNLELPYLTNAELAAGPIDEIMRRIDLLVSGSKLDDPQEVAAVMGGEARPVIMLSTLLAEFEILCEPALAKKSENQMRKWRNQRKRAIRYFIDLIGDKPITEISRVDAKRYKVWWSGHVKKNGLQYNTANKSIGFLATMIKDVSIENGLEENAPFADLKFRGTRDGKRPAFEAAFVQSKILAPGALEGLNDQARGILLVVAELGLRPSEVAELTGKKIFLNAKIPFIRVLGDERDLKTFDSERDIPLVGNALMAMREFPNGFPTYRDKEDTLSNTINKFLKSRDLLPTAKHSFYSLRHTFEDRLTAVDPPDKIIASLMGHTFHRERYSEGPSLEQKRRWLLKIAFKTPDEMAAETVATI